MLLALLLLQQLLIGLAGVNHESFVKADGFSAWLFPFAFFPFFLAEHLRVIQRSVME